MQIKPNSQWITQYPKRIGNCVVIQASDTVEVLTDWGNILTMPREEFLELYELNQSREEHEELYTAFMDETYESFYEKVNQRIRLLHSALERYAEVHEKE